MEDFKDKLSVFAREAHHISHSKAIANGFGLEVISDFSKITTPYVVVFSYGDLRLVNEIKNIGIIFCEHGTGFYYTGITHPSYAGSIRDREKVILRLSPNEIHAEKERETLDCPVEIIGVPKLDKYAKRQWFFNKERPTVAISFHFDCYVCPETRSSFNYFKKVIPELAKHFNLIGHAHPRLMKEIKPFYMENYITVVEDFNEVIEKADVFVIDNSSTIFEWCITEKPIVLLNPPFYRKDFEHKGNPRFWKHADIAPLCEKPEDLIACIWKSVNEHESFVPAIRRAKKDVLTIVDGTATEKAVEIIKKYIN